MNLVTIEKLTKEFGDHQLLDEVDLRINAGDRIGLVGINGSGKTTLLRVIAGLDEPDGGTRIGDRVLFRGADYRGFKHGP